MISSNDFCAEIAELVKSDRLSTAIDRLKTAFDGAGSPKLYREADSLNSKLNKIERSFRLGKLAEKVHKIERAWIAEEILGLCKAGSSRISEISDVEAPRNPFKLSELADSSAEKILGIENLKQISWIELAVLAARPVCRIVTPRQRGTGFLVGSGIILTNHHLLSTRELASESSVDFDYQLDASGGFHQWVRYRLKGDDSFHTSKDLDYSLVGVESSSQRPHPDSWGRAIVNVNADPVPSEHVNIIQHPMGGYKQVALTNNSVLAIKEQFLYYTTDTMPGSSGSPVFNDSWQVVALHRAHRTITASSGGVRYANEGVLLSAIKSDAGDNWPSAIR